MLNYCIYTGVDWLLIYTTFKTSKNAPDTKISKCVVWSRPSLENYSELEHGVGFTEEY